MLVLSRQRDQTIMIGDDVEITVVDIRGEKVTPGQSMPRGRDGSSKGSLRSDPAREIRRAAQIQTEDVAPLISNPSGDKSGPSHLKLVNPDEQKEDSTMDPFLRAAIERSEAGTGRGRAADRLGPRAQQPDHCQRTQPKGAARRPDGARRDRLPEKRRPAEDVQGHGLYLDADAVLPVQRRRRTVRHSEGDRRRSHTFPGGESKHSPQKSPDFLRSHGCRSRSTCNDAECIEMMQKFIHEHPEIVERGYRGGLDDRDRVHITPTSYGHAADDS
jgi:carbon storage regulator